MKKNDSLFDPENLIPKVKKSKNIFKDLLVKHKKVVIGITVMILLVLGGSFIRIKNTNSQTVSPKIITSKVDKEFEFSAVNNQGKPVNSKLKLKITNVEKTNQVIVKDQTYTATNNKLFLIVNLALKNDATSPNSIIPGDLVRLTYNNNEDNKYAPDLHNNLVTIAAISTKSDRLGFVIPETAKDFKLLIGELEGKKENVSVDFPS